MQRPLRVAAPAAVLAVLAAPAAAHAQTPTASLVPGTPCIRFVEVGAKSLPIQLAGFAPNAVVTIAADGAPIDTVTADAGGSFAGNVNAPSMGNDVNRKDVSLTADDGQGHTAGPIGLPEVRLAVDWPDRARGNPRVRFRAYGFVPGKPVYLHVRKQGKTKGNFKMGRADAPCGQTQRRLHWMPVTPAAAGTYTYYFDHSKRFDRSQRILWYKVVMTRTFHAAGAASTASHWGTLEPPRFG